MLKKTTVYLEESEIEVLKRLSFVHNTSMTEMIRKGIQHLRESVSDDEMKALGALGELRMAAEKRGLNAKKIMTEVLKARRKTFGVSTRRVVVDTNVVISGILGDGYPAKVIEAWFFGHFQPVISQALKREINEILLRPNIKQILGSRGAPNAKSVLGALFNKALMVLPRPINDEIFSDKDDHFLWELAVSAKANVIITGDKALLRLRCVDGIEILSPAQFCRKAGIR